MVDTRMGLGILASLLLLVGAFFSGVEYQKSKNTTAAAMSTSSNQRTGTGQGFSGMGSSGGFRRGDRAIGTVSSVSDSSITIQTRRGTSATYTLTSSTTVTKSGSTASVSDIQTGDTVFITLDSSNTQNASSIAVNPSFDNPGTSQPTTNSNSGDSTTDNSSTTPQST